MSGEEIDEYPDDKPFPSALFLGHAGNQAIHVVASFDEADDYVYIITAYEPTSEFFESDFKTSRRSRYAGEEAMTKNSSDSKCPLCGGIKQPGRTTYTVDSGTGLVVIRNVKAEICAQCGEEWIDNSTAQELERIVDEARGKRHQVEVLAM